MDTLTQSLRAICDPTRRTILDLLQTSSQSVTDLAQRFDMSRPAVSKHLAILREASLVVSHRAGRQQIYELDRAPLDAVDEWLQGYRQEDVGSTRPARSPQRNTKREDWKSW